MQTSIKQLKDNLSSIIHQVESGQEVIVTSHRRPVVKIVPISAKEVKKMSRKALFDDLEKLHQELGKVKLKKSMRKTVIDQRKDERS